MNRRLEKLNKLGVRSLRRSVRDFDELELADAVNRTSRGQYTIFMRSRARRTGFSVEQAASNVSGRL